jgi:lipopolysaccharide/colanic/teichoic acid biosynthesis glycosyltransferase
MVAVWERVVAAGLFLFVFPVLFITAVLVIVLSRRSPFIAHRRVGERGRELWILKLRTMWQRKPVGWNVYPLVERIDDEPMSSLKLLTDARVTNRFAFLCRRYSVDELPQLLQVAMGDLALVGPRPLTKGEITKHYGPLTLVLFERKPGITGLWQIRGRSRLSYPQRRKLDLFLVRHWSFRLYVYILTLTIPRVICGKNAW